MYTTANPIIWSATAHRIRRERVQKRRFEQQLRAMQNQPTPFLHYVSPSMVYTGVGSVMTEGIQHGIATAAKAIQRRVTKTKRLHDQKLRTFARYTAAHRIARKYDQHQRYRRYAIHVLWSQRKADKQWALEEAWYADTASQYLH